MNLLTTEQFERARSFMKNNARPLERALFEHEFEAGTADRVLHELAAYQNADGGFGHALEPDLRCRESSALATTTALQHLMALGADENNALTAKAIRYLLNTLDREKLTWEIIPAASQEAPRAIWWEYPAFVHEWGNPGAEIVGYLHAYRSLVPADLLEELTRFAIDYLNERCRLDEMHELFCYIRLADRLPAAQRVLIEAALDKFVDNCVVQNAADRQGYSAQPLQVVQSPDSRYYAKYREVIPDDLEALAAGQTDDGSWAPNWSWGRFDEVWEQAKEEWKGIITLQTLRTLKTFGRLL